MKQFVKMKNLVRLKTICIILVIMFIIFCVIEESRVLKTQNILLESHHETELIQSLDKHNKLHDVDSKIPRQKKKNSSSFICTVRQIHKSLYGAL